MAQWMQTYTGVHYTPTAPRVEDVRIRDIAHHLSMLCRFTGATKRFYSVAEHSVLVSQVVPPEHALAGLLHDATEAYVNDLSRPLKASWLLWGYNTVEARNWRVIAQRFELPRVLPPEVKAADNAVCQTERLELMSTSDHVDWYLLGEAAKVTINCWSPEKAEDNFMRRYFELTKGLGEVRHITRQLLWVGRNTLLSHEGLAAARAVRRWWP